MASVSAIVVVTTNPEEAVENGIAIKYTQFILTPDPLVTSDSNVQQAWFFQSGEGFTPGTDEFNDDFTLTDFISDKYGSDYKAQLFQNNGDQIFETNAINWIFDYKTGVLHIADPNASHQKPYRLTVYRYIGNTLNSSVDSNGTIDTSISQNDILTTLNGSKIVSSSDGTITHFGNLLLTGSKGHLTASGNISASGDISASNLFIKNDAFISGNLDLIGNFNHDGFNFIEDNITIITGSNSFGSTASLNLHTFTGSVFISSSQDDVFTIVSGSTNVFIKLPI